MNKPLPFLLSLHCCLTVLHFFHQLCSLDCIRFCKSFLSLAVFELMLCLLSPYPARSIADTSNRCALATPTFVGDIGS